MSFDDGRKTTRELGTGSPAAGRRAAQSVVRRRWWAVEEVAFISRAAGAAALAVVAVTLRTDADLWGHVRFGLDILRDRAVHAVDPYSFTSDQTWINHEWLSEFAMGLAQWAAGNIGLLALKITLIVAAYGVILLRLNHVTARWWLFAVLAVGTMPISTTLRPQLWTVLCLAIVSATEHWSVRRLTWVWPCVFVVWANAHGGWIVGGAVIGLWSLGRAVDMKDWRLLLRLLALCSVCGLATLINPYGVGLWRFLWSTVGFNRADIIEWQPIWKMSSVTVYLIWGLVAVTTTWMVRVTPLAWAALLPVLFLAVASVQVGRLIGLFAIGAITLVGANLPKTHNDVPRAVRWIPFAIAGGVALIIFVGQVRCLPVIDQDREAVGSLTHARSGRVITPFDYGQYAIWHLPQLKVSMDGRRETVYSAGTLDLLGHIEDGDPSALRFILESRPEYVWLKAASAVRITEEIKAIGYRLDVRTDRSVVFTRVDLPPLPTHRWAPACFP